MRLLVFGLAFFLAAPAFGFSVVVMQSDTNPDDIQITFEGLDEEEAPFWASGSGVFRVLEENPANPTGPGIVVSEHPYSYEVHKEGPIGVPEIGIGAALGLGLLGLGWMGARR